MAAWSGLFAVKLMSAAKLEKTPHQGDSLIYIPYPPLQHASRRSPRTPAWVGATRGAADTGRTSGRRRFRGRPGRRRPAASFPSVRGRLFRLATGCELGSAVDATTTTSHAAGRPEVSRTHVIGFLTSTNDVRGSRVQRKQGFHRCRRPSKEYRSHLGGPSASPPGARASFPVQSDRRRGVQRECHPPPVRGSSVWCVARILTQSQGALSGPPGPGSRDPRLGSQLGILQLSSWCGATADAQWI